VTGFSVEHFERFCKLLKIDTKEQGQVPLNFIGTQRYFVQEVAKGLDEGIHSFFVLKGRQLGISTISLALDLYWMFNHNGLQGALVTDTDDNRDLFKSYLAQYLASLPRGAKVLPDLHNRTQLVLKNRSRLSYIAAGKRKNESLGAGKAVSFMHGTECASWGDQDGMGSLIATLAQHNKDRLYIFESTAYGYNMWYELCEEAKKAKSQRFIFIGWWRNEFYRKERNSLEFKTYWDGEPTKEETEWIREVYEEYHYNISPEQLAWWRWYLAEQCPGSQINMMFQTFPPTANYAFQMTGSKFFSTERVNVMYKRTLEQKRTFYRYEFGFHFEQTKFIECSEQNAQCSIWHFAEPGGVYVLGADPAFGSSEWADLFAISVWRCFADRIVQVAEIATTEWTEAQFAWAMCHMAGNYAPCMVNLEMQGPGGAVFNEISNLKRYGGAPAASGSRSIYNVVGSIRDYLWKKQDSLMGSYAYQWQTTAKEKLRMLSTVRNYFEREMMVVNSPECADEFRNVHREGDSIGGAGRAKDDRVIATGLAVIAWNDWIMHELQAQNKTYALEMRPKEEPKMIHAAQRIFVDFMQKNRIRGYGGDTKP
jgi:hypothetical protein